jgi:serine phosphatase RsbU (regulator of sigma subunit)
MEVFGGNELADNLLHVPGLDVWIRSQPSAMGNGNDVHFVSSCATDRICRLLLSDVAGEASDVVQTANNIRKIMKSNVNYIDQSRFVRSMIREFTGLTESGRFATAVVLTFFAPTRDLTICNAGHPSPLLFCSRTGEWSVLEREPRGNESSIPKSVANVTSYQQFGVQLSEGDIVFCYTDALIESYGRDGELMGIPGLLQVVSEIDIAEPGEFIRLVIERVSGFSAENLNDDTSIVLLRCCAGTADGTLWRRLVAPFRVLWEIVRSLGSNDRSAPWPELSLPNIGGAFCSRLNRSWSKRNAGMSDDDSIAEQSG